MPFTQYQIPNSKFPIQPPAPYPHSIFLTSNQTSMRKFPIFFSGLLLLVACNNSNTSANFETKPDSPKAAVTYAYTPKEMPNWEMGSPEHIAIALNALKSYETGNLEEFRALCSDSVTLVDDGLDFHGTKDSLVNMLKKDRENYSSISIEMSDWESVHGKENKEDWVSLWYKAKWTGKDGKSDSAFYMDDLRIVNGKIRMIDTKKRRYPAKK